MRGLILDTSKTTGLLAITEKGVIKNFRFLETGRRLSPTLFPTLQELLTEENCKIKDFSYIAVGCGPGSFMGIRTSATIAKTFSFAQNIPLISFYSPLAFLPEGINGTFAYVEEGKMGTFIVLTGHMEEGALTSLSPPLSIAGEDLNNYLTGKEAIRSSSPNLKFIGSHLFEEFLKGNFSDEGDLPLFYPSDISLINKCTPS